MPLNRPKKSPDFVGALCITRLFNFYSQLLLDDPLKFIGEKLQPEDRAIFFLAIWYGDSRDRTKFICQELGLKPYAVLLAMSRIKTVVKNELTFNPKFRPKVKVPRKKRGPRVKKQKLTV